MIYLRIEDILEKLIEHQNMVVDDTKKVKSCYLIFACYAVTHFLANQYESSIVAFVYITNIYIE